MGETGKAPVFMELRVERIAETEKKMPLKVKINGAPFHRLGSGLQLSTQGTTGREAGASRAGRRVRKPGVSRCRCTAQPVHRGPRGPARASQTARVDAAVST